MTAPRLLLAGAGLLALAAALLGATGCLGYLARAGMGQLDILRKRRPIQEVLRDARTDERTRRKLEHVLRVREFSRTRLSLSPGESYSTYADIGRSAAAWNVSAAPELELRAHTWWFPIVGRVPYLGFFSEAEARAEAEKLRARGLDTIVDAVEAYSTLGWFSDPLLSSQLGKSDWGLTRLVIHESVHATIWFSGDVRFNESLASFVEMEGSLAFHRTLDGEGGHSERLRRVAENAIIAGMFRAHAERLRRAYAASMSDEWKRGEKKRLMDEFRTSFGLRKSEFRYLDTARFAARKYNNADFLSFLRYESGKTYFERAFRDAGGNWGEFLARMRALRALSVEKRGKLLDERS